MAVLLGWLGRFGQFFVVYRLDRVVDELDSAAEPLHVTERAVRLVALVATGECLCAQRGATDHTRVLALEPTLSGGTHGQRQSC